jgi:hypothetical protein
LINKTAFFCYFRTIETLNLFEPMAKQSKITVKHYLNTDLKPIKSPLGNEYKIYFLLRYLNQNTKIKSLISNTFTENEYNTIDDIIIKWQNQEVKLCENVINSLENYYPFDIKTFMQFYEFAKYPILENFTNFIEWQREKLYPNLGDFYEQSNTENQLECLLQLKKLVYNNENFINNELYLGNYTDYKKDLSKIKISIFERVKHENILDNYIIETKYELKKTTFLDYFINRVLLDYHYRLPKLEILPPTVIKGHEFYLFLINSFTKV